MPCGPLCSGIAQLWLWRIALCIWFTLATFSGPARAQGPHAAFPLDPLSKDEMQTAVTLLKAAGKMQESSRLAILALREPPKQAVLNFKPGDPIVREAFAVVYERAANRTYEATIDLTHRRVADWRQVPGVQPSFLEEDDVLLKQIVQADSRWQEAMRKRGITDLKKVEIGTSPGGYYGLPNENGLRVRRATFSYEGSSIAGVAADVDLTHGKVLRLVDTGILKIPKTPDAAAARKAAEKFFQPPKPLEIVQPQGPSFTLEGNEVAWQNWRFRFGTNSLEGLVLYAVRYQDRGRLRSVLYRAALSEMVVPYADPGPDWFFRNFFDEGEDSMGRYADSLEPGVDCPAHSKLFNAVFADEKGKAFDVPRALALYENDGGLMWKHFDRDHHRNEARAARDLVLSWIATVGNYDYGFNWVFHQDGTLEMVVLLTGTLETKTVEQGGASAPHEDLYGQPIATNVVGTYHQHFFNFRLDVDVDGLRNSVVEMNTRALPPGPSNPYGNAFMMKETLLRGEHDGKRQLNMSASRRWKIINASLKNSLGEPVGYMLMPGENSIAYAAPDAWVTKRAGFMTAPFWVTQYDPSQMHAAGDYVNQSTGGGGLPRWVQADRPLVNQDVVLWYTLGVTHVPRPEEWPVMNVYRAGFLLMPCGFFDRNPLLAVPR